jgi:hypothetical protein
MMLFFATPYLLDQPPSTNLVPSSLPLVAKLLGFVVSWVTSIYFLWLRNPPKAFREIPFFEQTQRVSVIVTSIFLILTWGGLGTSGTLSALTLLAIVLTSIGIITYFFTIKLTLIRQKSGAAVVVASPLTLLICFFVYTSFISCGLTSAGVFLAVLLTNPANAALGTNLTNSEPMVVTLTVAGKAVSVENQDTPFRVTSGQQNFACEQNSAFRIQFDAPAGASLVSQAVPTFLNFANARIVAGPEVSQSGQTVVASGVLRGLDYQNFPFGVRNCPGGGHGELVLSGTYRSAVSHEQDVSRVLTNDLSPSTREPVWVTLPDFEISSIRAVCKPKTGQGREFSVSVSSSEASASDGPFQLVYVPLKKQVGLSFR